MLLMLQLISAIFRTSFCNHCHNDCDTAVILLTFYNVKVSNL